jgi:hypothetical protein
MQSKDEVIDRLIDLFISSSLQSGNDLNQSTASSLLLLSSRNYSKISSRMKTGGN